MNGTRVLGAACAALLVSALGNVACGNADSDSTPTTGVTAQNLQAASVSLVLSDANGTQIGEGAGILIAPRVVLTAGHLISGVSTFSVTSADGKVKVSGKSALTYDWMPYGSTKSHPRRHDVGIIYLDRPINLDAYPALSSEVLASDTNATRIRRVGSAFKTVTSSFDKLMTFPHAYVTDVPTGETLDTGGAVFNEKNEIVGIVSGRGMTTGKLYVSRINDLVAWLSPKVVCGGKAGGALAIRTYGVPTPKPDCDGGAGGGSSSGSSGASSSGSGSEGSSGSAGSSGSSGAGSSGSNGASSGGPDGNCDDGGGGFGPNGAPNGGSGTGTDGSGAGSSGSSGVGSSGTNGSQGSSGTGGAGGGGTTGSSGSGAGSSGSSGVGSSGSNTAQSSSGAGGGAGGGTTGGGEACGGSNDNPELCPPEPVGSFSPTSGGGTPDDTMDYGSCPTCGGTSDIILR